jgi:UDP-N-acetylmuramyl pentapeptide phosphotransferase/UDP-N-acetylglucosamine-1-phosphate transferase
MRAVIVSAAVGFFFSILFTPVAIRGFTRLKAGQPIRLTPGHTWVELPDVSYAVTVKPGIDSTP